MNRLLEDLLKRYPALEVCGDAIEAAGERMVQTYRRGGKLLVCGNGGSSADSDHIVGELMKGFLSRRPMRETEKERFRRALGADAEELIAKLQRGLPAISLPAQSAVLSAFANDVDADLVYAQLIFGYGNAQDLFLGISTSGNSRNVLAAAKTAKALGLFTLALTGEKESRLSEVCDLTVRVPATETYQVQELHLPVYHYLCAYTEQQTETDG